MGRIFIEHGIRIEPISRRSGRRINMPYMFWSIGRSTPGIS